MVLTIIVLGVISVLSIPIDILPVFNSPAVQALTFYSGMPAESIEKDITARMERWTGQAAGTARQDRDRSWGPASSATTTAAAPIRTAP